MDLPHGDSCAKPNAHPGCATRICGGNRQRLSGFELRVAAEIAGHAHADALIHDLLQLVRQRDVLDDEGVEFEAQRGEGGLHLLFDLSAKRGLVGRHIEKGDVAGGEDVSHACNDRVAQLAFEIARRNTWRGVPLTCVKKVRGSAMR